MRGLYVNTRESKRIPKTNVEGYRFARITIEKGAASSPRRYKMEVIAVNCKCPLVFSHKVFVKDKILLRLRKFSNSDLF